MPPTDPTAPLRTALEWALDNLDAEDEVLGTPVVGEMLAYAVKVNGKTTTMVRSTEYAENLAQARAALAASQADDPSGADRVLAAVRDWVEYGAADGSWEAEMRSREMLERIAREYASFAAALPESPDGE